MKIDKSIIKELSDYLDEFNLTEIEITEKDTKIKVSQNNVSISNQPVITSASTAIKNENTDSSSNINSGTEITSPIIGTAYHAPEPGAKKFVEVGKKIKKVAVLGGSGSFAIEDAIDSNADCFITADLKYHDYFKADKKIILADIGHYESEHYTKELILEYLNKKIPKFACIISKSNTNPVNYF